MAELATQNDNQLILPKRSKKKKMIAIAIAGILIIGGGITVPMLLTPSSVNTMANRYVQVVRGDVTETVTASGTVQAPTSLNLNFSGNGGRITEMNVKVGDVVKQGQVLARLDDASAKAQVSVALASLQAAEAKLAQAKQGATAEKLASQQASIDAAVIKAEQAKQGITPEARALAEANLEKAKVTLEGAKTTYENQKALSEDRSSANQQLVSAQNSVEVAQISLRSSETQLTLAKEKLEASKKGPTEAALNAARVALTTAKNAYENAKDAEAMAQGEQAQLQTNTQVHNARSALANAQKTLADLEAQPDPAVIAQNEVGVTQAQISVDQSKQTLANAQQNLAIAQTNYNNRLSAKSQLDNAKNAYDQAEISYKAAVAQYNQTVAPPDETTIAAAQASVVQAQAQYNELAAPPDQATVMSAQASVDQAKAQLEQQQAALDNLLIKAPADGVITAVNGNVGELPSSGTGGLIVMNDASANNLQVVAQVAQSDIGKMKSGLTAEVTTTSFPDKVFTGTVLVVYPEATTANGVTTYQVLFSVDNAEGLLKPGMTSSLTINVGTHKDVLYVPTTALKEQGGQDGVMVKSGAPAQSGEAKPEGGATDAPKPEAAAQQQMTFRPVQLGLISADRAEIVSGLQEGEEVSVALSAKETQTTGNLPGAGRMTGGGVPGGGTGGSRGGN